MSQDAIKTNRDKELKMGMLLKLLLLGMIYLGKSEHIISPDVRRYIHNEESSPCVRKCVRDNYSGYTHTDLDLAYSDCQDWCSRMGK